MDWHYNKYLENCKKTDTPKEEIKSEEEFNSSGLRKISKVLYFGYLYGNLEMTYRPNLGVR